MDTPRSCFTCQHCQRTTPEGFLCELRGVVQLPCSDYAREPGSDDEIIEEEEA
jgi:hypothetical protein